MNILIFNWQDIKNPLSGGAEVHLHEVFSRIAAMGHNVTLFCSMFPGATSEEIINGIKVIREGGRYLFNYRVMFRYLTWFRRLPFDIVIDDLNKIPFYTPLYVRNPLLGITHHLFRTSIFLEVPFPLAAYVYLTETLSIPFYRRIHFIVGSPSTYRELIEVGFNPDRLTVINYSVDHSLFRQKKVLKSQFPVIGYLGRLKKYKSIEHLLDAFAIVLKSIPQAQLIIVGDGDYRSVLEAHARSLNLGSSVRFTGFVSDEGKVNYLNQMDFVVNTSSKEGWGLTVIEANACGRCIIASNVPGLRDSVVDGETGFLYEYGNIEQLAEKILLLLRDKSLKARLSKNALEWSKKFQWEDSAKKTLEVLERVASSNRR